MSTTAEIGEEFILHYGVKGMKWGVRNDRQGRNRWDPKGHGTGADVAKAALLGPVGFGTPAAVRLIKRADGTTTSQKAKPVAKKIGKGAAAGADNLLFEFAAGADATHRAIVEKASDKYVKTDLARINKKPVYVESGKNKLLNRAVSPLNSTTRQYRREVREAYVKRLEEAANSETNVRGTRQYTLTDSWGRPNKSRYSWKVQTRAIQHAAGNETFYVYPQMDEDGLIVGLQVTDKSLEHDLFELGEEFLMHYGVKGMKWGVRRDRNTPGFTERTGMKLETKRRERRPEVHARAVDTIGGSRRVHTRIKARGGEDSPAAAEALNTAKINQKLKKSGMHSLSNKELQDAIERMRLETQMKEVAKKRPKSRRKEFIDALLEDTGNTRVR